MVVLHVCGHNLLVLFHIHVRVFSGAVDTMVVPTVGMVVALEVEVVPRCTTVHLLLHALCVLAPFRKLVEMVGRVELACMVQAVLAATERTRSWYVLVSFAR